MMVVYMLVWCLPLLLIIDLPSWPHVQWPESRDATAMCDATRIAHPQTASDSKHFVR